MNTEPQNVDNTKNSMGGSGKQNLDVDEPMDSSDLLPLSAIIPSKFFKKILKKRNSSISTPLKKQHKVTDSALPTEQNQESRSQFPEVSVGRKSSSDETFSHEGRTDPQVNEITETEQLYLAALERLFSLEDRLKTLKNTLLNHKTGGQAPNRTHQDELNAMYVPVAELKEKLF